MPFYRLFVIIVVVISLAAATVAIALVAVDSLEVSPALGLAGLSLLALCAALAWRVISNRRLSPK